MLYLNEKGLSPRIVYHQHRVLSEALKYAVRQGWLARNPCEMVDPPRPRKTTAKTLSPEEVGTLLEVAKNMPFYPIIFTALSSGLRQGELLGLRWRDVNLDLAYLSVSQVLYKRRGVCELKEPKSEHSRRRVSLTPRLTLFLRVYKAQKETQGVLLGKPLTLDDLVFSNIERKAIDPGTLTHTFARMARVAGLRCRFHDLRHTFASLMLMAGANPKVVSEALGHSSVGFTLDTYSHVLPTMQERAMSRLDKLLAPSMPGNENVSKLSPTFGGSREKNWQGWQDSNPRPAVLETAALPN
jgi:integrase